MLFIDPMLAVVDEIVLFVHQFIPIDLSLPKTKLPL